MFEPSLSFLPIISTLTLLVAFGWAWNRLVEKLDTENVEGYSWAMVAGGVAVTVAMAGPLIGWNNVLVLLLCFAASGAPMAFGEVRRHRRKFIRFMRHQLGLTDGQEPAETAREPGETDRR